MSMDEIDLQSEVKPGCWICGDSQCCHHVGSNRVFNSSAKISEIFQEVLDYKVNELLIFSVKSLFAK